MGHTVNGDLLLPFLLYQVRRTGTSFSRGDKSASTLKINGIWYIQRSIGITCSIKNCNHVNSAPVCPGCCAECRGGSRRAEHAASAVPGAQGFLCSHSVLFSNYINVSHNICKSVGGKYTKYIFIYSTLNLNTHLDMGNIFFSSYAI